MIHSAPLPAFELSGTASAPRRVPVVPVDRMQGPLAQMMHLRRSGLGLRAGNGRTLGTRCSRFARLLSATRQECAKIGMFDVIRKLILDTRADKKLYQGNFAYSAMICDCVHPREIILHCFDFVTNLTVYVMITFYFMPPPVMFHCHPLSRLYAMIAPPSTPSMATTWSAQASALTSATGCA